MREREYCTSTVPIVQYKRINVSHRHTVPGTDFRFWEVPREASECPFDGHAGAKAEHRREQRIARGNDAGKADVTSLRGICKAASQSCGERCGANMYPWLLLCLRLIPSRSPPDN